MAFNQENVLDGPLQYIKSVGPRRAAAFARAGINNIRDLLFYFPSRHLDRRTTLTSLQVYRHLLEGFEGELTVVARVVTKERVRFARKEMLKVQFKDASGFFECVWFQGIKYFYEVFNTNDMFAVSGKPSITKYGNVQFVHPDFDKISEEESQGYLNTGKIIPFYRIPKELRELSVGDLSIRRIVSSAVEKYSGKLEETLPPGILNEYKLLNIIDTVRTMHFPESVELYDKALQRLKFEELFYIELLVALRKHNYKKLNTGNSLKVKSGMISEFIKSLPFSFTGAQLKVLAEIRRDMENEKPMNRLLQGDVGSGKTIVALTAMLIAVDSGYQAVLMAPTEILADQHAKSIARLTDKLNALKPGRIKISLLIGGQKKSVKNKNLSEIETQQADIIIGTHALFEEGVTFKKLGLVVVDEQHRFGVEQRAKLFAKGKVPDVLVMSATPIPRTLTMTVYGDLDVSIINEMPKDRKKIKTVLRGEGKLPDIYRYITEKNKKEGCQAFIVYPLVEESEKLELKAAETHFNELQSTYLKELRLGLIHGRMKWTEKEEAMLLFQKKHYDVLISTTVIEVGIDIPDANIIVINDAHRFGLSQLHQLRGRVGRGSRQAYCILVTKDEYAANVSRYHNDIDYLSPAQVERYKSSVRMKAMADYIDGFKIAEIDLKLRGPGDIFGTRQSGFPELKYADITADTKILSEARSRAFEIINSDPELNSPSNVIVKKTLLRNYSANLKFGDTA